MPVPIFKIFCSILNTFNCTNITNQNRTINCQLTVKLCDFPLTFALGIIKPDFISRRPIAQVSKKQATNWRLPKFHGSEQNNCQRQYSRSRNSPSYGENQCFEAANTATRNKQNRTLETLVDKEHTP